MMQIVRLHLPPAAPHGTSAPVQAPVRPPPPLEPASPGAPDIAGTCPGVRARTSALREFLAQATGSVAASCLGKGFLDKGPWGPMVSAGLVVAGLGGLGWRAMSLAERAFAGAEGCMPWSRRTLLAAALPVLVVGGAALAVGTAEAPAAVALFAGGLMERAVRDLSSHALATGLPRPELVNPEGTIRPAVSRDIEWGRSGRASWQTMLCTTVQCAGTLALAPHLGHSPVLQAATHALSTGLLEAARAVINHKATERKASEYGLALRPQARQGLAASLSRAADVLSLREVLALPGDCVDLFTSQPAGPVAIAVLSLSLGLLKGAGEARSALVNLGRAASRHQDNAPQAVPAVAGVQEVEVERPDLPAIPPTLDSDEESSLSRVPPPA